MGIKRVTKTAIGLLLVLFIVLGIIPTAGWGASTAEAENYTKVSVTVTELYDYAYEILDYVNEERVNNGLGEVQMDTELLEAAMLRAAESCVVGEAYSNSELASSDSLAHTRPNGTRCFTVSSKSYGENIAMGQTSTFSVMFGNSRDIDPNNASDMDHSSWMRSSGHRSNILEPSWRSVGIGVVYYNGLYRFYWSQEFGVDPAVVPAKRTDHATETYAINVSADIYNRLVDQGKLSGGSGNGGGGTTTGRWRETNGRWWYEMSDGNYARNAWIGDRSGNWYAVDAQGYMMTGWSSIGGTWYYFASNGVMANNEWRDGCWLSSSGAWNYKAVGEWYNSGSGWWFGDSTGWYACNQWQKIDGYWYYFDGNGYMVANAYVDGYYLGPDGAMQ